MFYHGTSSNLPIQHLLIPPKASGKIQENGRKKNLDKVFFTTSLSSAKVYAGRSKNVFGGNPIVYRVIPMGNIDCLNSDEGSSVYMSDWAFVEEIEGK